MNSLEKGLDEMGKYIDVRGYSENDRVPTDAEITSDRMTLEDMGLYLTFGIYEIKSIKRR